MFEIIAAQFLLEQLTDEQVQSVGTSRQNRWQWVG